MGDLSIIGQMKNKDQKAYELWLERYGETMIRFAYQYGCSLKEAQKIAVQTFKSLFADLEGIHTESELVERMYQIAIENLSDSESTEGADLTFEDDQQLHHKIIGLERNAKLVLVLSVFQEMSTEEVSTIVGIPQPVVAQMLSAGCIALKESQIDKRLRFLKKSYGRLKVSLDKEKVFQTIHRNETEINKEREKIPRKTWMPLVAGGLMLVALLLFTVVNSEEYKKKSSEKYIGQLEERYEEELAKVYDELGLDETSLLETDVGIESTYLGKSERAKFERLVKEMEKMVEQKGKIDKEKVVPKFEKIITDLETPETMLENLYSNPLENDFKASESFIETYLEKNLIVNSYYFSMLFENEMAVKDILIGGGSPYEQLDQFPESYQLVLQAMEKQEIQLVLLEDNYVVLKFNKERFRDKFRASLHKELGGYVFMLEFTDNYEWGEASAETLFTIENTMLSTTNKTTNAYQMLTHTYLSIMRNIVKGTEEDDFFERDGTLKLEKRREWEKFAEIGGNSAAAHIAGLIVEEMKESGWRFSETQIFFDAYQVEQVLSYAQTGDINSIQVDEYDLEHSYYGIDPWPNRGFDNLVADTYERFIKAYDVSLLEGSNPLTIFAMYHYANEKKDPKTMWYLENRVHNEASLELYITSWEPETWSIKDTEHFYFDSYNKTILTSYSEQGVYQEDVKMVLDEGRWKIVSFNKLVD